MAEQPSTDYPDQMVTGSDWDWKYLAVDDEDSSDFDWTVDEWEVTVTVKDRDDQVLATLSNVGTPDGTVTLDADGLIRLHLPGAFTAGLTPTRTYINSTEPRAATWRNRGNYFFDVQAVNVTEDYTVTLPSGVITVQQNVT
jgi:hypothetical protein